MNILAHPLTKRLAIALPIGIVVGLLRAWLGDNSPLVGLLVGVASYFFADWILSTQADRKDRFEQVSRFLTRNYWTLTKWVFYIILSLYLLNSRNYPIEGAVKQVFSIVETIGLLVVLINPCIAIFFNSATRDATYYFTNPTSLLLKGFANYSVALWLIGYGGDDLYTWVIAHPDDAAIVGTSIAIVWLIVNFSAGSSGNSGISSRVSDATAGMRSGVTKPTARDNCYTAAHEAGHALVYAALDSLPEDVKLVINDSPDEQGILGFITYIRSNNALESKSFAEWYMLVLLAGKMGETTAFGDSTLGSSNDHERWVRFARSYLANHNRGIYYADPQNKFEQEQNEAKLESLQKEQLALLEKFFETNVEVFIELMNKLLETRSMDRDALSPFLSRVMLPEGFPLPFGTTQVSAEQ